MKLEDVQPHVAVLLAASPALAAFGSIIQPSLLDDDDDAAANLISTRLGSVGVVIEVGEEDSDRAGDRTVRGVIHDATFAVYTAESPKVTHAPKGKALRAAVIAALSAPNGHDSVVEIDSIASFKAENGYVLREYACRLRVTLP